MQSVSEQLELLHSDGVNLSSAELLRYQQLAKLMDLTPKRTPQARLAGSYLTRHKGRGMEFDEARHYQPGDDIRAIDWRVTARTGKTHTKVYREERERPVFIFCDFLPSMHFGTQLLTKSVQAAHVSALLSWSAADRGDKVGALIFSQEKHKECKPVSRKRAVLNLCHAMTDVHQSNSSDIHNEALSREIFADSCARARRLARPGSLVYLVSDFQHLSNMALQHLGQMSRHCEVRAIIVNDPMEHSLPSSSQVQYVNVSDGTEQQPWVLGDSKEQADYEQWRATQNNNIESQLKKCGLLRYHLSAGIPLDGQLQGIQREKV